MIAAFAACGVPVALAVVAVLSYQAVSTWLPVLPGAWAYVRLRRTVTEWRTGASQAAQGSCLPPDAVEPPLGGPRADPLHGRHHRRRTFPAMAGAGARAADQHPPDLASRDGARERRHGHMALPAREPSDAGELGPGPDDDPSGRPRLARDGERPAAVPADISERRPDLAALAAATGGGSGGTARGPGGRAAGGERRSSPGAPASGTTTSPARSRAAPAPPPSRRSGDGRDRAPRAAPPRRTRRRAGQRATSWSSPDCRAGSRASTRVPRRARAGPATRPGQSERRASAAPAPTSSAVNGASSET